MKAYRDGNCSDLKFAADVRLWWAACWLMCIGCGSEPSRDNVSKAPLESALQSMPVEPSWAEVTGEVGIDFRHHAEVGNDFLMPSIMGSGACWLDIDGDQNLDLLLIDGQAAANAPGLTLYQQVANKFVDVTAKSGLSSGGYGMGAAVGDIDNDGDSDLFLTCYGEDRLFLNDGQGVFEDITTTAGIANSQWSTATAFFDYDRDGWLDLFVVNYVDYFPGSRCEDGAGRQDFCGPESLQGTVDRLYRNLGTSGSEGPRFEDVTVSSGIASRSGKGLGLLCRDFNGDGLMDVFVANDGQENHLWIQLQPGHFSNEALLRGIALNRYGEPEANMGVVAEDFNRDGLPDLLITHLREESHTLYRGASIGQFVDQTIESGLSVESLPFTGFGVAAEDFDHDGDVDVTIATGGVKRGAPSEVAGFWSDYAQRNEFYLNDGKGRLLAQNAAQSGDFLQLLEVSRAIAVADYDNDGDQDFLMTNCDGPARLYRNDIPKKGSWLQIKLTDPERRRTPLGAQVLVQAGKRFFIRELNISTSYLASHDARLHFGLGDVQHIDAIRVFWPDGAAQLEAFPGVAINQSIELVRGSGRQSGNDAP